MNIVFVSTFQAPCGIASYTEDLAGALQRQGHQVFVYAEQLVVTDDMAMALSPHGVRYARTWLRTAPYASVRGLGGIARSITSSTGPKPDLVHVQHEFGLFPRTSDLVQFAREVGLPVIFTLHTVDEAHILGLARLALAGRLIVHTPEAAALLYRHPVAIVPHGLTVQASRRRPAYVLVPGFIGPTKGTLEILHGYWRACTAYPEYPYPLRIAGLCRDMLYESKLQTYIHSHELDDRVTFQNSFVADPVEALKSAAAVVLGGGDTSPFSASGQLHQAIGAGVPVIAKRVPIYNAPGGAGVLHYATSESLAQWLLAVQDPRLSDFLEQRSRSTAQGLDWELVARATMRAYEG